MKRESNGSDVSRNLLAIRLFKEIEAKGANSYEYELVKSALPNLDVSKKELEGTAARLYPNQVGSILRERSVRVQLIVEPDDRLLQEDLSAQIKKLSGYLDMVKNPPVDVVLHIKRLQWDERYLPERTQTVTYGSGDINIIAQALLMPQGASYMYELSTGGSELSFAFEVRALGDGFEPVDELVREKIAKEWTSCSNARIQNVFGGVKPASFTANPHMQSICTGGRPVDMEDMREAALKEVASRIKKIAPIAKAIAAR